MIQGETEQVGMKKKGCRQCRDLRPWKCFYPEKQESSGEVEEIKANSSGVRRVRIVMRKRELERLMSSSMSIKELEQTLLSSMVRDEAPSAVAPQSLEQVLHALRSRRIKEEALVASGGGWTPALRSIPEEI